MILACKVGRCPYERRVFCFLPEVKRTSYAGDIEPDVKDSRKTPGWVSFHGRDVISRATVHLPDIQLLFVTFWSQMSTLPNFYESLYVKTCVTSVDIISGEWFEDHQHGGHVPWCWRHWRRAIEAFLDGGQICHVQGLISPAIGARLTSGKKHSLFNHKS